MSAAGPQSLSERRGLRIAALVTAAPVVCCGAGLVVLLLLKHHQAGLQAAYLARHMTPFAAPVGWMGEPSSFLHVAEPAREVLARNPAQWGMNIGMTAFALTPALVIAAGCIVYGAVCRNRAAMLGGLLPLLGLGWYASAPLHMMLAGREIVLDAAQDTLTLNGSRLAALSEVERFSAVRTRSPKGRVSDHLRAVLATGAEVELGGPDDRPDLLDAARPLNAALARLRIPPG